MIIRREITPYLENLATQFPVVAVMGPRQSGKTTLVKSIFTQHVYVSLEDLDRRMAAKEDPRGFLASFANQAGLIIDEIQEVPELLSYMQGIVDQTYRPGWFIITGSQNFLLHEKISQTLAGRIALLTLLPLTVSELSAAKLLPADLHGVLLKGFYPRLYDQNIDLTSWCNNYISTYIERDVRQVLQISNILAFQRFMKLCAARVGNILNYANLAADADISQHTAKAWLSILEASYIIKLLPPYHGNFNKRVIKASKLYFYDTALVCALLGIKTAEDLQFHPFKGGIFESFVVSECFKYSYNHNDLPQLYFWRDVQGHEIDLMIEKAYGQAFPIEVKSGMTITSDVFKGLNDWRELIKVPAAVTYLIYGGPDYLQIKQNFVYPWSKIADLLTLIYNTKA